MGTIFSFLHMTGENREYEFAAPLAAQSSAINCDQRAEMNGTTYTYEMENETRGYHVYGSSWKPKIGDFLLTDREVSNEDSKFAVAVYEELSIDGKKIVGRLPVEFSRIAAYFIENGGETSCKVTGKRNHSKGPRGGMAILCKLCWTSSNKRHVTKLDVLHTAEKIKILRRYGLSV